MENKQSSSISCEKLCLLWLKQSQTMLHRVTPLKFLTYYIVRHIKRYIIIKSEVNYVIFFKSIPIKINLFSKNIENI